MADVDPIEPTDLIVLPTLERLQPYRGALGMVFSVALGRDDGFTFDGSTSNDRCRASFLQPWTWSQPGSWFLKVEEIQVYRRKRGDDFWKNAGTVKVTPRPTMYDDRLKTLRGSLERRFCHFGSQHPAKGSPWIYSQKQQVVDPDCRPWSAFVGHLTQLPWPVPQALGLSFFEDVICGADEELVAAPVLRVHATGPHSGRLPRSEWLYPDLDPAAQADGAKPLRMSYSKGTILSIGAQVQPVQPRRPPSTQKSFFDMESLWVKGIAAGDDWFHDLDSRVTMQLDAARVALDWLRGAGSAADLRQANYPQVARQVLQALRLDSLPAPAVARLGKGLVQRVARSWNDDKGRPFAQDAATALERDARPWLAKLRDEQDLGRWACWAAAAIEAAGVGSTPRVLDLALTPASGKTDPIAQLTLGEVIGQLTALSSQLAAAAVGKGIFQAVWQRWLAQAGSKAHQLSRDVAMAFGGRDPADGLDLAAEMLRASVRYEQQEPLTKAFAPAAAVSLENQRKVLTALLRNGGNSGPLWRDLHCIDPAWCDARSTGIAEAIFPDAGKAKPTAITTGITVQVDGVSVDRGDDDLLADIQGVALLMRDVSGVEPAPWRCLNLAKAEIDGEPLPDPVLLPSRLIYQDGLSSAALTYDNEPLAVAGPLAAAQVAGASLQPAGAAAASPLDAPLIDFTYWLPTTTRPAGLMPELVFGRRYELLPFLVTNTGAVPEALAPKGAKVPWPLAATIPADVAVQAAKPPVAVHYRRTVSVGALRLAWPQHLPAVPAGVAPRLRELPAELLLPSGDPLLRNLGSDTADDTILAGTPLILLAPWHPSDPKTGHGIDLRRGIDLPRGLDFVIASPTLDLRTWDRWVAADATMPRERRMFVRRSYHQKAYHAAHCSQRGVSLVNAGVFLDDPAVVGIWAEIQSVSPSGELDPPQSLTAPILLPDAAGQVDWSSWQVGAASLASEQRQAVRVEVTVVGPSSLLVTVGGKPLVAVDGQPAGETATRHGLCRLTLYAVLADVADSLLEDVGRETVRTTADGKRLTSPWHLFLEVVPQPFTEEEVDQLRFSLWRTLSPRPAAARAGLLRAELDLSGEDFEKVAWQIDRADLQHQVWGWRGRPPSTHPDLPPDPGAPVARTATLELERYLDFEMAEFGERSDEERRDLPMQRSDCAASGAGPFFLYQENLESIAPAGDFRAIHHRLSARIWNRYRALLPPSQGFVDARDCASATRWRRLFVPCRFRGAVPAPKIKFVLPLTQEDPAHCGRGRGPGLMVAVDGPWYQVGGLAEELAVEVMTVTAPDTPAGAYYQAGTDPIVTCASAAEETRLAPDTPGETMDPTGRWAGALPVDDLAIRFEATVGAIGHTRDHTTVAPTFLASSFLLAPPRLEACNAGRLGEPAPDFAWWFFKLRFARRLAVVRPEGAEPATEELLSEWSAPFWVQLLPAMERVETDWFPDGTPVARLRGSAALVCSPLPRQRPAPFYLFAVMTRRLSDFAGRANQESYVGVWWWNPCDGFWVTDLATEALVVASSLGLVLRWIEVQSPRQPEIQSSDDLWRALFDPGVQTEATGADAQPALPAADAAGADARHTPHPAVHADAARCRIVRISKPFDVQAGGGGQP